MENNKENKMNEEKALDEGWFEMLEQWEADAIEQADRERAEEEKAEKDKK